MILFIIDVITPAIGLLLGLAIGGRPERIAATATIFAFLLSATVSTQTWQSLEWQILSVDTAALLVFWWLSITSDRFWPYWVTGCQIVTVLVHLQSLVSEPLNWAYGMLSIYLSIPIVVIIGGASVLRHLRQRRSRITA
jgi:hypothetical protein